jgi:hypothetical protein
VQKIALKLWRNRYGRIQPQYGYSNSIQYTPPGTDNLRGKFSQVRWQAMLNPKTALDTYQYSCQAKAHRIARFMAGRKGFDLSRQEAEHLDDMINVMVDQFEAMEDLW